MRCLTHNHDTLSPNTLAGRFPSLKKMGSPSWNGAAVINQRVFWARVPIAPGKSRNFKMSAKVSTAFTAPTTTTGISTYAYMLDNNNSVSCLSTMTNASVRPRSGCDPYFYFYFYFKCLSTTHSY